MKLSKTDRIELKFRLEKVINECFKQLVHKKMFKSKDNVPNFWKIFRNEFEEDVLYDEFKLTAGLDNDED